MTSFLGDLAGGLELGDVLSLVKGLGDFETAIAERLVVGPAAREALGEEEHAVDRNLKRSDAGNDLVVGLTLIVVRDKLTIDVRHRVDFRYQVHNDLGASDLLLDRGGDAYRVSFVLVLVVASVPAVHLAVFTVFNDKNFL